MFYAYNMVMDKKYYKIYELDCLRVRVELAKLNKSQAWLARQCNTSKQNFNIHFKKRGLRFAGQIAKILNVPLKDILSAKL